MNIPSSWTAFTVEQIVERFLDFRGRTPKKLSMDWGGGEIPALSANNVQQGKINFEKESYHGSEALYYRWMTSGDCAKGDIVMTMEAPLGNIAQIPDDRRYILSQRVILLKTRKSLADNDFLFQRLSWENFQSELQRQATGTTAQGIQRAKLEKISVTLPPLPEQQKIAAILSRIDQAIEQTEALIAKQQRIKAGLMHDLLTKGIDGHGNIRSEATHEFKDSPLGRIPMEWRSPMFEEITPPDAPICYGIVKQGKYCDDGIPVIAVNNLQGEFDNLHLCSSDIERMYARSRVRAGDVLISVKGTTGRIDIVPESFQGNISRGIARIRPDRLVYSEYLLQLFTSPFFQSYLDSAVVGTTRAELSIGILRKMYLLLPRYDEQLKVASVLKKKAAYLSNLQSVYEKLKRVKTGLMQDLLTGDVPVTALLETQPQTAQG